jgi:hypothetical protein
MSSKYLPLALFALTLGTLGACDKKETPPTESTEQKAATPTPPAPAPVAAAAEPKVDIDSLPVEEEFEADAEKELTAANLNAKLDELEKEIDAP